MKKLTVIIISFLICVCSLHAQNYYTRNYSINDGLPSNHINSIFKDSRGFLWIGTDAGLAKFDGTNFEIFSSQNGISGDNITDICEGNNGEIWVATYNTGLTQLNGNALNIFNSNSGIISNSIVKLYYSKKLETLFIGTDNGLSTYNDSLGFKSFQNKQNTINARFQITDFIESDDDLIIFTNGSGAFKYLKEIKDIVKLPYNNQLLSPTINSAFISKGNKDTLICFNRVNLEIIGNNRDTILEKFGPIVDFVEDSDTTIWIAAAHKDFWNKGGLYQLNKNGLTNYSSNLGLKTDDITSVEYDISENILWVGTSNYGIYLYPLTNFSYYTNNYFGLKSLDITHLHISNNQLFITTKNGVIIKNDSISRIIDFDLLAKKFNLFAKNILPQKYSYLNNIKGSFNYYQKLINEGKYTFSNPYVRIIDNTQQIIDAGELYKPFKYDLIKDKALTNITGVFSDSQNNSWIGTNVGVFKINNNDIDYYDLESIHFSSFIFDSRDRLYASSWDELFVYPDFRKNALYSVYNSIDNNSPDKIQKTSRKGDSIWFLSKDHGAYIYIKDKFYNTFKNPKLQGISFSDICFDKYNNFILGGINGTVYIGRFDQNDFIITHTISSANGIQGTSIRWLKCSQNNLLIIGTNAGLNIIDLKKLYKNKTINIKTFNTFLGFIDYAGKTSALDTNNSLWIGSNEHLINVNLNMLNNVQQLETNFYIRSIEVNDEKYNLSKIKNRNIWTNIPNSTIELPHNKNSITFHFDVIEFLNPDQINFSYKLEGFNKNWSEKNNERKIIFQNLNPGKYRLRIKAFYNNGANSNKELSINFTIASPLWKKWYVLVSSIVITLLTMWYLIHLRTLSIQKKALIQTEIAERIMEFEMKALRAQMNPHFIFNAINSIQNFMLDNDIDEALNYLSDFAKLIRLTLDNVSKKRINLEDELEYLRYYLKLEKMRFDKKFEVEIKPPKELSARKIQIPPMLIQPFIENSIKHGFIYNIKNPKITIQFEIKDESVLVCSIEDNGVGRAKSKELNKNNKTHKSKGTFITNERLDLLNRTQSKKGYRFETIDLYNEFNIAIGTRVNIYIPI